MHNAVKWPNRVNSARFLKYVWPFYNIMHESVNTSNAVSFSIVLKMCQYKNINKLKICTTVYLKEKRKNSGQISSISL